MAGGDRHDDNDGSDIFWPGYVDATTNLILNLLFLVTILIVAVFMFALELGRSSPIQAQQQAAEATQKAEVNLAQKSDFTQERALTTAGDSGEETEPIDVDEERPDTSLDVAADLAQENVALKKEVTRLRNLLAQKTAINEYGGGLVKTVDASVDLPAPRVGLDETLDSNAEVMIRFKKEAIAFTDKEREELLTSLQPVVASGQAVITVEVPDGFSEAKRIAYYRAMAVRNLLLEMEMPSDKINVTVLETASNGDATLVKVR